MPNSGKELQPIEPTANDKLQWCLDNLGQRITTLGVDAPDLDATTVRDWAQGTVPELALPKVDLLYGAAKAVTDVYDEQTARAFLRSANPYVGEESVLLVIARSNPEQAATIVNGAVAGFLG